jgi:hypothetical protein
VQLAIAGRSCLARRTSIDNRPLLQELAIAGRSCLARRTGIDNRLCVTRGTYILSDGAATTSWAGLRVSIHIKLRNPIASIWLFQPLKRAMRHLSCSEGPFLASVQLRTFERHLGGAAASC